MADNGIMIKIFVSYKFEYFSMRPSHIWRNLSTVTETRSAVNERHALCHVKESYRFHLHNI